jgi:hypothetical protein
MNYLRIVLAGLGGTVAYFALGGLSFVLVPQLGDEFRKYPTIYRTQEGMKSVMPIGMAAMLAGILVLAVLYAMVYQGGSGAAEGGVSARSSESSPYARSSCTTT